MPRVLGVDYGKVRVGLAVSDPLGLTALPLEVVERPKRGSLVDAVVAAARRVEAERIVVGLPLRLDGSSGVAAEAARSFAKSLEERSGLPVVCWDERLSTVEASRGMRAAGVSARRQRGVVDKVAAAVILASYLESQAPAGRDAAPPSPPLHDPHERDRRDDLRAEPRRQRSDAGASRRRRGARSSRRGWLDD
jgi:putative Holliday junction resolvase